MRDLVVVTRSVPGDWRLVLEAAGLEVQMAQDGDAVLPRVPFLHSIAGASAACGMLTDRWDREAFDAAGSRLRVVANFAVGFNNVDLAEATRRGVAVTNTPDVLTEATADTAFGLLIAAARRFGEGERVVRAGGFHGWGPSDFLGVDLVGKTLGIIGAGRIGSAIARRSRGWSMRVVYSHGSGKPEFEQEFSATRLPLPELLATSDFVSLSVPFTSATRHLIGARELALMKPTAVLINTARGPVVDEVALVRALRERRIFAAGLDVYEEEPKLAPGLMQLENAVLLPHLGSATVETRSAMGRLMAENVVAVLRGGVPPNLVNRDWKPR
jgi:glyoxylate reductase